MKVKVKIEKEVDLVTLSVRVPIRHNEDAIVNGIEDTEGNLLPCRESFMWCPIIDLDSGIIRNWTQGVKAEIHFKVVDEGFYHLLDKDNNIVLSIQQDYVPKMMCPKEEGYGDYIIMDIDENGQIQNWNGKDLSGFIPNE